MALPWLNWPFAFAWIYLAHNDWIELRRSQREGRRLVVAVNGGNQMNLIRSELNKEELTALFSHLFPERKTEQDAA